MNKEKVMIAVNESPQDFDLDLLIEKLVFIEKVEKGLDQLESGNTVTHAHVKQQIKEWQK